MKPKLKYKNKHMHIFIRKKNIFSVFSINKYIANEQQRHKKICTKQTLKVANSSNNTKTTIFFVCILPIASTLYVINAAWLRWLTMFYVHLLITKSVDIHKGTSYAYISFHCKIIFTVAALLNNFTAYRIALW